MTPTDLETLRGLVNLSAKTTGSEWHTGCMCDPESVCSCRSILTDTCLGSVCQITKRVELPIGEGGNDAPPESEAIANAQFIAASRNAIPALTALLAERDALRERQQRISNLAEKYAPGNIDVMRVFVSELQSILNATLSEGERNE